MTTKITSIDKGELGTITFYEAENKYNDKIVKAVFENGIETRCTYQHNANYSAKVIDFAPPVTIDGKLVKGMKINDETEIIKKAILRADGENKKRVDRMPRVCWECGRIFNHRPAADGTCGEC